MKRASLTVLFFSILLNVIHVIAQPGEWTWLHGSNTANSGGTFGTQGVPSAANNPPAMYETTEFKDLNGNFWLYGGVGGGTHNDLWKYDPSTNEWTWMSGTNTPGDPGVFGTIGVSSPLNHPPALGYGAATWSDLNGNFWIFGGFWSGDMNTLWKYDVGSNEWTWMNGSNVPGAVGFYGTQGVPSPLNTPGAREETACTWTDNNGDLWLFGGYGFGGNWNDLWRYHIATNEWTWMKGSQNSGQAGVYGTMGVEDTVNTPGSRQIYSRWKDLNGNLWLFGGGDYLNNYYFNDMWRYNPSTNNWTWMNGSNNVNGAGSYGTQCIGSSTNVPQSRFENRGCCTDINGNFWMFGGGTGGGSIPQVWNDLWMYCPATNVWTWVDNDTTLNPAGNWGSLGTTAPTNKPNGRSGNLLWSDDNGHLYTFGGSTANYNTPYQDIWKYNIDPACAFCNTLPVALFSAPNHICPGTCTDFHNLSINASSYLWIFAGATPGTSTDANPTGICYNTPGNYTVSLIATNINGSDTLTLTNYITVYPYPAPQGIAQQGDTLFANAGAVSYQWYANGVLIPGATEYYYVAPASGDYNVVATDQNGCEVEAVIYNVIASVKNNISPKELELFPNPSANEIDIISPARIESMSIIDMLGREIQNSATLLLISDNHCRMDISALSPGTYWIEVSNASAFLRAKFLKE